MAHVIENIARGFRFGLGRIVHLFLATDTEGVEAYLCIPLLLTAVRMFQAAGAIPLYVPDIPGISRGLSLMLQSNDFWSHALPVIPAGLLLLCGAVWGWVALISGVWWARFTGVTVTVAVFFFFSTLLWLHLGPGGAIPYVAPLIAASWVSRRLILDIHKKKQQKVVTDQACQLAGQIVNALLEQKALAANSTAKS